MRAVVDTNVVLVANDAHEEVSPECVLACIDRLEALMRHGTVVIDADYVNGRLGELSRNEDLSRYIL